MFVVERACLVEEARQRWLELDWISAAEARRGAPGLLALRVLREVRTGELVWFERWESEACWRAAPPASEPSGAAARWLEPVWRVAPGEEAERRRAAAGDEAEVALRTELDLIEGRERARSTRRRELAAEVLWLEVWTAPRGDSLAVAGLRLREDGVYEVVDVVATSAVLACFPRYEPAAHWLRAEGFRPIEGREEVTAGPPVRLRGAAQPAAQRPPPPARIEEPPALGVFFYRSVHRPDPGQAAALAAALRNLGEQLAQEPGMLGGILYSERCAQQFVWLERWATEPLWRAAVRRKRPALPSAEYEIFQTNSFLQRGYLRPLGSFDAGERAPLPPGETQPLRERLTPAPSLLEAPAEGPGGGPGPVRWVEFWSDCSTGGVLVALLRGRRDGSVDVVDLLSGCRVEKVLPSYEKGAEWLASDEFERLEGRLELGSEPCDLCPAPRNE